MRYLFGKTVSSEGGNMGTSISGILTGFSRLKLGQVGFLGIWWRFVDDDDAFVLSLRPLAEITRLSGVCKDNTHWLTSDSDPLTEE